MFHMYRTQFKRYSEKSVRQSIQELRLKAELLVDRLAKEPECASTLGWMDWAALFEVVYSRNPDRENFRRLPDATILVALTAFRDYAINAHIGGAYFINTWREAILSLWVNESDAIAQAAAVCLPVIQAKLQAEKDRKTLLRSGERVEDGAELLRPASDGATKGGSELLRPTSQ